MNDSGDADSRCARFDRHEPIALCVMHDDIGYLRRCRNHDALAFDVGRFEMPEHALRIADRAVSI